MIVADLFSGVGGLSLGFEQAGFDVAFAVEFDKDIAAAYEKNHVGTTMYNADISELDAKKLLARHGKVDVIVGGPPCQGFSQKGKRLSINDDRNFLFRQYVRFVDVFRPKFFVIENVPNIITTANGFFKNEIIKEFSAIGYDVKADVFDVSEFGVPQQRRRAVFIGQLKKNTVAFPKPTGKRVTVNDAISDMPPLESGEGEEFAKYLGPAKTEYQRTMRKGMRSGMVQNHQATAHSAIAMTRMKMIPKGMGKEVLPPEHRTKSIYSGTWCRLIEDDIAATITTRFDTPSSGRFTHPTQNRCITVREAARIQSFPDSFIFYGTKTSQMKQVGNAVPPIFANAIAKSILKAQGENK